jgi:ribokinase
LGTDAPEGASDGKGGKIVVIGGINMDLFIEAERFPLPGETFEGDRYYTGGGGKGANQAIAAAQLVGPGRVEMVGRVGSDVFGEELLSNFERYGVGHDYVEVGEGESSGIALIFMDGNRENYVLPVYGANAGCGGRQVEDAVRAMEGASVLLLQQEIPLEVSEQAAAAAVERGLTVILDPGPVRDAPGGLISLADVLAPNQIEAEGITGVAVDSVESAAVAAGQIRELGVAVAIVKLGEAGCYVDSEEVTGHFPAPKVEAIATVAAGDAFAGGLAVGLAEGMVLADAVPFAVAAASLSVTRDGAQDSMPARADVEAFMAGSG